MSKLVELFTAMKARDEAEVVKAVREALNGEQSSPITEQSKIVKGDKVLTPTWKKEVKEQMLSVCGTSEGKIFTTATEAEEAYSWFLDLWGIKSFNVKFKKDEVLNTDNIKFEVWDTMTFLQCEAYPFNREVEARCKSRNHLKGELTSIAQLECACVLVDVQKSPRLWSALSGEVLSGDKASKYGVEEGRFKLCKIDAHSRTHNWLSGVMETPETVVVKIYSGLDEVQIENLYNSLNSPATAETASERTQHMNKSVGFEPKSGYCKGNFKTAVDKCGLSLEYTPEVMEQIEPALKVVDGWDIPRSRKGDTSLVTQNGVKRALIASLGKRTDNGIVFSTTPSDFFKLVLSADESVPEVEKLIKQLNKVKGETNHQEETTFYFSAWQKRITASSNS